MLCFSSGKVLFRRSHIRDVAVRRLKHLDNYCKVRQKLHASLFPELDFSQLVCSTMHLLLKRLLIFNLYVVWKSALSLSVLYPLNIYHSFFSRPQHLSPLHQPQQESNCSLCLSFPVTNVNRQHMKETREMGARRGKNKRETKNESADFNCSNECR